MGKFEENLRFVGTIAAINHTVSYIVEFAIKIVSKFKKRMVSKKV